MNAQQWWTGQPITSNAQETRSIEVECACCKKPVSLRVGWIDRYVVPGTEKYVHYNCLSPQRLAEIEAEERSDSKDMMQ